MDKKIYYNLQKNESGEKFGGWINQSIEAMVGYLRDQDRNKKIIDIGSGYGNSLEKLQELGFNDILGIELVKEKVIYSLQKRLPALCADMHDLSFIEDNSFDILFCSHTIEHSLNPVIVIKEFIRIAKEGLIICPLDPINLNDPPHTSPFHSISEWKNIFLGMDKDVNFEHKELNRLGKEVWTYFKHN